MTTPALRDARGIDVEGLVQLGLTLAVGAVAAVASWSHVLDLANRHGQSGGLAWAVAACIETSAVSAGLEVRRRRRHEQPIAFPLGVLVGATALQLAAQVAQAERTPWGVVLAAVPAVTFLTLVKLVLARPRGRARAGAGAGGVAAEPRSEWAEHAHKPADAPLPASASTQEPAQAVLPAASPLAFAPAVPDGAGNEAAADPASGSDSPSAVQPVRDTDVDVGDLLLVGRAVLEDLARDGLPLTRRTLLAGVRARGRSCSTERAGALLRALRGDEPAERAG